MPAPDRPDLTPAADALAALLDGVDDAHLDAPTPCPDWTVGDLLDHVHGLAEAFRLAARKESPPGPPPVPAAATLDPQWRSTIPPRLAAMAEAWRDPAAWDGTTSVGGVDQPGALCALTGMDELVVHGWDLARATGQPYDVPTSCVAGAQAFVDAIRAEAPDEVPGLFGRPTGVADSDPLTHLLATTGRDPSWRRA